jgi:hypothetical protein
MRRISCSETRYNRSADTLVAHVKNKGQSLLGRCVTLLSAFSEDIDLEMSTNIMRKLHI